MSFEELQAENKALRDEMAALQRAFDEKKVELMSKEDDCRRLDAKARYLEGQVEAFKFCWKELQNA